MKKLKLIILTFILLAFFNSCEKCLTSCKLIPAKILRYDCDRVIFQLTSSNLIGDSIWTDVQTGNRYSNVVSYYNTCEISELTKGKLTTLYVQLDKNNLPMPASCYQCLAVSPNPPQTKVIFKEVSLSK